MVRAARYVFVVLALAFAAGIVLQVFFIGLGLFAGSENLVLHTTFGWILHRRGRDRADLDAIRCTPRQRANQPPASRTLCLSRPRQVARRQPRMLRRSTRGRPEPAGVCC